MAKKRNTDTNMVAASQLSPTSHFQAEDHDEPTGKLFDRAEYLGLSAQVAQDTNCTRNTRLPNGSEYFPVHPAKRTIDKYFQFAKGGPLYIDEPITKGDEAVCLEKAVIMKKMGLRYCYIGSEMELGDVLAQLETA